MWISETKQIKKELLERLHRIADITYYKNISVCTNFAHVFEQATICSVNSNNKYKYHEYQEGEIFNFNFVSQYVRFSDLTKLVAIFYHEVGQWVKLKFEDKCT